MIIGFTIYGFATWGDKRVFETIGAGINDMIWLPNQMKLDIKLPLFTMQELMKWFDQVVVKKRMVIELHQLIVGKDCHEKFPNLEYPQ